MPNQPSPSSERLSGTISAVPTPNHDIHGPAPRPGTFAGAPTLDLWASPTGLHHFSDDTTINFQCNRWAEAVGPRGVEEVGRVCGQQKTQADWIEAFLALATSAREEGRDLDAAFYDRGAEFFMTPEDPRKTPTRRRLVGAFQNTFRVVPVMVPYGSAHLPAYDLRPQGEPVSTWVVFGGFDSYIEEFLPALAAVVEQGRRVIAFDGPGQGGALEEQGLVLTPHWEQPVAAVLDHFALDEVTLVGISLGGELVVQAAAFEERVRRVVAWNAMDDLLETVLAHAPLPRPLVTHGPRRLVNSLIRRRAATSSIVEWGLWQGMHITGTTSPVDFLRAISRLHTREVSARVRADVLLLQGREDHYVPGDQMWRQARALTGARSVTTRVFTAAEQASSHCQVGNTQLALRTILSWEDAFLTP